MECAVARLTDSPGSNRFLDASVPTVKSPRASALERLSISCFTPGPEDGIMQGGRLSMVHEYSATGENVKPVRNPTLPPMHHAALTPTQSPGRRQLTCLSRTDNRKEKTEATTKQFPVEHDSIPRPAPGVKARFHPTHGQTDVRNGFVVSWRCIVISEDGPSMDTHGGMGALEKSLSMALDRE
ncbi:hypothetical protein NCC49_005344 [Naganishia albida]|nr:hypothetical protein NCC49_005344 [Naganishia albida]